MQQIFRGAAFVAGHAVTIWINLFPIDPQSIKKMVNPNVKILWKNSHQLFFKNWIKTKTQEV